MKEKSFSDGFLEDRGWLRIPQQNAATGNLEIAGSAITGIASYTYAQFVALTAGEKTALAGLAVHISDVHTSSDGIGGSYVVRDASPAGWAQISGPMYYATFDLVPPAGTYPGWRYRVGSGIGIGGADIYDTGARLRYVHGMACVAMISADVLHTAAFNAEKIAKTYAIPRNNLKSIMQDGDQFELTHSIGRPTLTATTVTRVFRFGTGNTVADTPLESNQAIAATKYSSMERNIFQRRSSTTIFSPGPGIANKWQESGTPQITDRTVLDMDAADSYLHLTINQSANTDEAVALKYYRLNLIHSGA